MAMPLLEIQALVYEANAHHATRILDGLSLSVAASDVHALIGTNGTGKSTLASVIMGCEGYGATSGDVVFDGRSLAGLKVHERARLGITMAWQEPVRFEGITVNQYLSLGRDSGDSARYLELVGLSAQRYGDRMVDRSLSGGERKRIELASLLALQPKLAILDEPDSGIDMLSTQDIINVIAAFKAGGSAVLLITHREEIAAIADRASQLCGGRIVCTGNPAKVAEHYKARHCDICTGRECHYV
jgi:Fe-S cluster assembly ATP-binding protein